MEVAFDSSDVEYAFTHAGSELGTRDAVIDYFKRKYPGEKTLKNGQVRYEWKEKIVDAEIALNPDAKRASLARRYQRDTKTGKDRYLSTKPSKKQQEQYKALSDMLPKIYRVRGTLCVRYSSGPCEARHIDETFQASVTSLDDIYEMYHPGGGGEPCEEEDHENPRRPGRIVKGCKPSLFVSVHWA